ncbi:MAG: tRNA (adenosine(37)-N6)-dimethylallyltransferase MiaA [Clostridia bacterium]|nr:tRNA (adenosine(37)-N6)-dimethylallyltransferase MiaA [Clostridia bacterium]
MNGQNILCRVLTGPTASGKSALGLALAEKHGWHILCMDSMQIYRRMDIGTAKPTPAERERVPHGLLDLCEPTEAFTVADYREAAEALVREKARQGREVLFVGGTGLYLQALIHPMGLGDAPANEARRTELRALAESEEGKVLLHRMLEALDPDTAARLPLNDTRRAIRAIEVTETTGVPFSRQADRAEPSPFIWRVAALKMPRELLYGRINRRVLSMMDQGLAREVESLLAEGVSPDARSMQGLGYKEMIPYLRGERNLEQTVDAIQKGTRHYAKRQETFLRRLPEVRFLDAAEPDLLARAEELLSE